MTMGTAEYSDEPQQDRQHGRSSREIDEELQAFITKPDARSVSMSNMHSLPLTLPKSDEPPQESTSGVATTARKRGRPKKQVGLAQPVHVHSTKDTPVDIPASAKRRGRPRKYVSLEMTEAGSVAEEGEGKDAICGEELRQEICNKRADASYVDPSEQRQAPAET